MAGYLQHVNERLDAGDAVCGPAAARLINAARDAATRYEGMFLSPRQARALLADPGLQVHDNPRAFLACNYDPAKALCHLVGQPGRPRVTRTWAGATLRARTSPAPTSTSRR